MGDLIDRQNAIDVLEILADKMSDEGKTVMAQAVAVLKDLQSAEPERISMVWKPSKGRPAYEKGICNCGYVLSGSRCCYTEYRRGKGDDSG